MAKAKVFARVTSSGTIGPEGPDERVSTWQPGDTVTAPVHYVQPSVAPPP